ncbi:hypothetical protein ANN_05044 [Periplaneta americana]|uniref:Uncharacterized protein n=1 Tax=Periplaneta americana TaxID=6978 RepID=A0ABQ8TBA1_PERAM|nr:hypothetical protein ANN_05044 [Periplaneta americana]
MAGLCEGGNEPPCSLKASSKAVKALRERFGRRRGSCPGIAQLEQRAELRGPGFDSRDVRFELTTSVPQERRSRGWRAAEREKGQRGESGAASGAGREERARDFLEVVVVEFSVIPSVSKPEQASQSSTRVCVRICVSIRRPEFECSGPQLEGPEFECRGRSWRDPVQ